MQLYSFKVIQLYIYTTIQLYNYTATPAYTCTARRLSNYTTIQLCNDITIQIHRPVGSLGVWEHCLFTYPMDMVCTGDHPKNSGRFRTILSRFWTPLTPPGKPFLEPQKAILKSQRCIDTWTWFLYSLDTHFYRISQNYVTLETSKNVLPSARELNFAIINSLDSNHIFSY